MSEPTFSHLDAAGTARMVDVGAKPVQRRTATATGCVRCAPETVRALRDRTVPKGDVLTVARVAAIQAAKRTDSLIPLCHSLPLDAVDLDFALDEVAGTIDIRATATTSARTGVEMEALTAVSVAALTVYDMCKAVDRGMVIDGVRLVSKTKG